MELTFWELTFWEVDILEVDILRVDILGVDILRVDILGRTRGAISGFEGRSHGTQHSEQHYHYARLMPPFCRV